MKKNKLTKGFAKYHTIFGFTHIILLMAIVLVGIAGVGYFALKNRQIKIPSQNMPISPTSFTTQIDKSNWKTYTNNNLDFTFKYPEGLNIIKEDWYGSKIWRLYLVDKQESNSIDITVTVNPTTTDGSPLTIDNFDNNYKVDKDIKVEKVQFALRSARKTILTTTATINGKKVTRYAGVIYDVFDSNRLFKVGGVSSENLFIIDQILSTFKFTDDNTTEKCTTDLDCPENTFCDHNMPGGMGPNGYVSGESYGSQKCIQMCKTDKDCPAGISCNDYEIIQGDLRFSQRGCRQ